MIRLLKGLHVRLTPLSIAAIMAVSLSLTSCASQQDPAAACEPALKPGSVTETTKVTSKFGSTPSVVLPSNTTISASERAVISRSESSPTYAQKGDLVSINFAVFDGDTGNEIDSTNFSPKQGSAPVLVTEDFAFPGLYKGLQCAQPGERLLLAIAPKDGLGDAAVTDWGLKKSTALIMVVDVVAVSETRASGAERQLPNGFPNVVTLDNGQVGIVLPPSSPPAEIRFAERLIGTGPVVTAEDVVIGQALSVDWATRSVLSSTWQEGTPTSFGTQAQGTEVRGFLTGQTVGSQVVIIAPTPTGATVTVVDILGVGGAGQ